MGSWLKELVPMIGTALGGPLGGIAASFVADAFGLNEKTVESVTNIINSGKMTPEQLTQLKNAEIEFKKYCMEHEINLEKVAAADRDSARKMQMVTQSKMPAILTLMITLGFFGVLGWMMYDDNVVNSPPLLIMLGSLGTAWTGACAFWFGTTKGSADKNNLLAQSTPTQ